MTIPASVWPSTGLGVAVEQAAAPPTPRVSIVMPCLNEEQTVGICVAKARGWLSATQHPGEVIVVDNGSTDRSVAVAIEAGARVVHEVRPGYGSAYLRGFAEATGDVIVMGDSDDTYDFSDLSLLVEPLTRGYDLVLGNRFRGGMGEAAMPWTHRYIGTPIINLIIRTFSGVKVGDSQSGFRAFTRSAMDRLNLRSAGMELASEMLVRAARTGLRVAEVPAPYGARLGESKLRTVRDGWRHLRFLLLAAPDFLFTVPGIFLSLLGAATFALSFLAPEGITVGSLTWQPIFAGAIFLAVGVSSMVFGVMAKIHACNKGWLPEDGWVRVYRRYFRLETILLLAAVLMAAGGAIDLVLFVVWASGASARLGLQLAALAQTLLIVGAQMGMAGFLIVTLDAP
jgi:glycosyltransferase involved in cell wall biosynthesis